ncbi:MAG: 6-phosphogluconate dehydrogenase [Sphingobacteriales bacterium]|nr:6-phosphogluconate dehydrogenase [Sphingobacteriales bacterium]MBI3717038.1 6-phosphogluconate dehydrogenase [Sphingobacteriales bacterium]
MSFKRIGWTTVLILLLVGSLLIYWFYYNPFSEGERKGSLIKISKKGNVFKTYEGEMWLSCRQTVNAEKFLFSIADKSIADSLEKLQDECVQLKYKQYRRTLPWRGDSEYLIVGYERVK